jgi:Uncharacterized ACR, COG1678
MADSNSLANNLLIAMPSLADGNFAQSVTLVCEHSDKGALGIVLNKPLEMKLGDVLAQMKLDPLAPTIGEQPVLRGGPVHTDRGFVLHRPGGAWDSTHRISDCVQVTTSRDVLAAIARGEGPRDAGNPRQCLAIGTDERTAGVRSTLRTALAGRVAVAGRAQFARQLGGGPRLSRLPAPVPGRAQRAPPQSASTSDCAASAWPPATR